MTNPTPGGAGVAHLPIQDVMITRVYQGEIILYSLFIAAMGVQYIVARPLFRHVHYFFVVSLVAQLLASIVNYDDYYAYNLVRGGRALLLTW